jgi:hypothetical protein
MASNREPGRRTLEQQNGIVYTATVNEAKISLKRKFPGS